LDTRRSYSAAADTTSEESCSRGAHIEREQQALDPQLPRGPRAEAFRVYLRDLRHLPGPKIRRLRSVPEDQGFSRGREECEPRFWTILQESFYASYTHRGSQLSQHRMLQFTTLRAAADGEAILPFFDYQRGLVDLVTQRSRYVPDWVRVSMPLSTSMLTGSLSGSCLWVSRSGLLERGSQSYSRLIFTMTRSTTWRTPTSSLLVMHTHLSFLPMRRSVSCSSSRSFPAHP
jgi:hypothetical protein